MIAQTLKDNLELVVAVVGAASAIGGVLFAVAVYLWKASRWAGRFLDRDKAMAEQARKLTLRLGQNADQTSRLRQEIAVLAAKIEEREKDQARLEGKIEQNTAAMMKVAGDLREVVGSQRRLWQTLHVIHPDKVPKRAGEPS